MTKTPLNRGMTIKSTVEQLLDRTNRDPADAHIKKEYGNELATHLETPI